MTQAQSTVISSVLILTLHQAQGYVTRSVLILSLSKDDLSKDGRHG
jgi:hypothetical protein